MKVYIVIAHTKTEAEIKKVFKERKNASQYIFDNFGMGYNIIIVEMEIEDWEYKGVLDESKA